MTGRAFLNFFQACCLLLLLLAVALLAAIATMHFAIHGAEVEVPKLKGMTVAEARAQAEALGLELNVDGRFYSSDIAAGHILSQHPAPGMVVRREWRMRVSESLGSQKADVPNVVGADERKALLLLRNVGLDAGSVSRLPYADAPEGTVIAQDPPARAQGIASPNVALLVAAAPTEEADGFRMPDLTGMTLAAARKQLAQMGVTTITTAAGAKSTAAPPPPPGAITAQQPQAGLRIEQKTPVRLTVAP